MNLFELFAKISVDTGDYEREVKKSKKTAESLADSFDDVASSADDAGNEIEDIGVSAKKTNKPFGSLVNGLADLKAGFDLISGVASKAFEIFMSLSEAFWDLADATSEYREQQGKLKTAFESAEYSAEDAKRVYSDLYKILGDTDQAIEASQLMASLAENTEDMSVWTKIAAGVYGTFGDALPIEGLIESANETARVGQVTGNLADALNWASINEDEFNQKLAACTTESERNKTIMETLSGVYDTASDAFYRNNEQLIQSRDNQLLLQESMGNLGGVIEELKNSVLNELAPSFGELVNAFGDVIAGAEGAEERFGLAMTNMVAALDETLPVFAEKMGLIIETMGNAIADNSDVIIQTTADLMVKMQQEVLLTGGKLLLSAGGEVIESYKRGVLSAYGGVVDAGRRIAEGVWQGIQSAYSWLSSNIRNFFSGIVEDAKSALGIHSPSTVFAGIGKNMALGLGDGWKSEYNTIRDDISNGLVFSSPNENNGMVRGRSEINVSVTVSAGAISSQADATSIGRELGDSIARQIRYKGGIAFA